MRADARRRRPVTIVVAVAAASLLAAACTGADRPRGGPRTSPPLTLPAPPLTTIDPRPLTHVERIVWEYAVPSGDRALDVYFTAHATGCRRLADVRVAEVADAVTITLLDGADSARAGTVCPAVGVNARTRVPLGAPLGDRRLMDGGARPPAAREVRAS